ncbi:MAG: hypothetical protein RIR26_980 [Pseudomonadota bacterium]|jgi:phosphate transport system permease protein
MSERLFEMIIWFVAALSFVLIGTLIFDIGRLGTSGLSFDFLTQLPVNSGRAGGILPILTSTLIVLCITLTFTVPLGIACSLWLSEFVERKNAAAQLAKIGLDALAGVPSIVMGLFGHVFFSQFLGFGFSLLSGGLTLSCMALPIFIKTTVEGLTALDSDWRRQAAALGLSKTTLVWNVLLPASSPAIAAGLILALGRATAESAALIFTSGYVDRMPESVFDSGRVLSVHIYDLAMNVTGGDKAAYATALTLTALILLINVFVIWVSEKWLKGGALNL